MNKQIWKAAGATILTLAASLLGPLHQLHAQSSFALPFSLSQSSPATAFSINSDGSLQESGPFNGSATLTLQTGPQMVWFPAFAAFRVGAFSSSQTSMGQYSFATGTSTASGSYSVATGGSTASGAYAVAMGISANASGANSVALGTFCAATGQSATALGAGANATGRYATATGLFTTASGDYSFSAGDQTMANSYGSFVVGMYNTGVSSTGTAPTKSSWVTTDPIFEVGNGQGFSSRSDALVVYKNGNATFQGVVMVAAGGDIPMYTGN